jgi:hypothetical protein
VFSVWIKYTLQKYLELWLTEDVQEEEFDNLLNSLTVDVLTGVYSIIGAWSDTEDAQRPGLEKGIDYETVLSDGRSIALLLTVGSSIGSDNHPALMSRVFPTGISIEAAQVVQEQLSKGSLFKPIAKALAKPRGQELQARLKSFMTVSAQDALGNGALQAAATGVQSEGCLVAVAKEDDPTILVMKNAANHQNVPDVLFATLASLLEAEKLWTSNGLNAARPQLVFILNAVFNMVVNWDLVASVYLSRHIAATVTLLDNVPIGAALSDAFWETAINSYAPPTSDFAKIVDCDVSDVPLAFSQCIDFATRLELLSDDDVSYLKIAQAEINAHIASRTKIMNYSSDLLKFAKLEADLPSMIEVVHSWDSLKNDGGHCNHVLEIGVRLEKMTEQPIEPVSFSPGIPFAGQAFVLDTDYTKNPETAAIDVATLTDPWLNLVSHPYALAASDILCCCGMEVLNELFRTLNLEVLSAGDVDRKFLARFDGVADSDAIADGIALGGTVDELSKYIVRKDHVSEDLLSGVATRHPDARAKPCRAKNLLGLFLELRTTGTVDVSLFTINQPGREVEIKELTEMLEALIQVHDASSTFAYVADALSHNVSIVNGMMTAPFQNALKRLGTFDTVDLYIKAILDHPKSAETAWKFSTLFLSGWWAKFRLVYPIVQRLAVQHLATVVHKVAGALPALPKYAHYLNDTTLSRGLVQRHLLTESLSLRLKETMQTLNRMDSHIVDMYDSTIRSPGVAKDASTQHDYAFLADLLSEVRKLSSCVCGCSIVLQARGEDQAKRAQDFMSKRREFVPKSLAGELDKLGGVEPPPKRVRISSKGAGSAVGPIAIQDA